MTIATWTSSGLRAPAAARTRACRIDGAAARLQAENLPVLHLQWLLAERNQMKQAWHAAAASCSTDRESGSRDQRVLFGEPFRMPACAPPMCHRRGSRASPSRPAVDRSRAIVAGARHPGLVRRRTRPAFFEPLEIWHIPALRDEFRRRVGRSPRPDRSYLPTWPERAQSLRAPVVSAARRRFPSDHGAPLPHGPDDAGSERASAADPEAVGVARRVVKPGVPLPAASPYPGAHSLVRSVVEGLRAIGADFNFNPGGLADLRASSTRPPTRRCAEARRAEARRAAIDYLVAGPVNALFVGRVRRRSCRCRRSIGIDRRARMGARVLSRRAARSARRAGHVPAASTPTPGSRRAATATRDCAVVYWKSGGEAFCEQVETESCGRCGLEPRRVALAARRACDVRPGRLPAAARSVRPSAIFLSTFETQGLALAEAWVDGRPDARLGSARRGCSGAAAASNRARPRRI